MNPNKTHFIARPPQAFTEAEIQNFIAMVCTGGEVGDVVLEQNVRNAKCLVVARQASLLVGIAALKCPHLNYFQSIKEKAKATISSQDFQFELGYIFVVPDARRQGLAAKLCQEALAFDAGKGVFATARTNNIRIQTVLLRLGFQEAGQPYKSTRSGYQLQLFLRHHQSHSSTLSP